MSLCLAFIMHDKDFNLDQMQITLYVTIDPAHSYDLWYGEIGGKYELTSNIGQRVMGIGYIALIVSKFVAKFVSEMLNRKK